MSKKDGKLRLVSENERPKRRKRTKMVPKALENVGATYGSFEESNEKDIKRQGALTESTSADNSGKDNMIHSESLSPLIHGSTSDDIDHNDFMNNPDVETKAEYEYETDDEDIDKPSDSDVAQDQSTSFVGPIIGLIIALILVIGPIICFATFGILYLAQNKDVCPNSIPLLWIFGVVFMILFFPTPCIVPNYKWGALVWSILFLMELPLIVFPQIAGCPAVLNSNLYTWSLWAFWYLVAHLVISLIAFIVSLSLAPKSPDENDISASANSPAIVEQTSTAAESTPLVRTVLDV